MIRTVTLAAAVATAFGCGKRAPAARDDARIVAAVAGDAAAPRDGASTAVAPAAARPRSALQLTGNSACAAGAKGAPFAGDPSVQVRALGAALASLDLEATAAWTDHAAHGSREGHLGQPNPPPALSAALDALRAWDRSGAVLRIDCMAPEEGCLYAATIVARAALATAAEPDAPVVHAVGRLGQALRGADNTSLAIATGLAMAVDVAEWAHADHRSALGALRGAPPESDVAFRVARAEARCQLAALPMLRAQLASDQEARGELADARRDLGLPASDRVADDELDALETFLHETEATIARARSAAELAALLDARLEVKPKAALIRYFGTPYAVHMIGSALERYQAALKP